jgi:hypothetical protein
MQIFFKKFIAQSVLCATLFSTNLALAVPLQNSDFSLHDQANPTLPSNWATDGEAVEIALDNMNKRAKTPSVRVQFKEGAPYAGLVQRMPIDLMRGKTFSAQAHVDKLGEGAQVGIWMRAYDKERKSIAYANTYEVKQGVKGQWTLHQLKLAIPAQAEFVLFGASIYEKDGTMWLDAIQATLD